MIPHEELWLVVNVYRQNISLQVYTKLIRPVTILEFREICCVLKIKAKIYFLNH